MAIRIILHGGNADRNTEKNDKFFREIINRVNSDTVKILCVYFARPPHRWEDSYDEDQYTFKRVQRDIGREIEIRLAADDMGTFYENVLWADVVLLSGGMKGNLKEALLSIGLERFRQMLDGKTLVGISAGANILSKYYYSMVANGKREGTGFLDIKLLTHFSEDNPEQIKALKEIDADLPIVTIREEEYIVIDRV